MLVLPFSSVTELLETEKQIRFTVPMLSDGSQIGGPWQPLRIQFQQMDGAQASLVWAPVRLPASVTRWGYRWLGFPGELIL